VLPKPYNTVKMGFEESVRKVVASAGRTMVLFSGGSKVGDDDLILKARTAMECGATGLIFGRNMWQRPMGPALDITDRISTMMKAL
jgi:class I fructose-bisphosphate aldolase